MPDPMHHWLQQKETFQGYCNVHPAAQLNSAEGYWGHRHIAASPAILHLHLSQSLLEKGLSAEYSQLILWLHGKEDSQQRLTAEPSLGLPSFLKETSSETPQGPYSKTQH